MEKSEYIYMIMDNAMVYQIKLPPDLQGEKLNEHLANFDDKTLGIIAGFNKNLLDYFFKISRGKSQKDIDEPLKKLEKIMYMINPTGNLSYLGPEQTDYVLSKIGALKLNEITEEKIATIADEQLEKQMGGGQYNQSQALENQLASASFYMMEMGYSQQDIQKKLNEVRQDSSKLDAIFTLSAKEIHSLPPELRGIAGGNAENSSDISSSSEEPAGGIDQSKEAQDAIDQHIQSISQEISDDRAKKVDEIMEQIKMFAKEEMTEQYEKVFRQIHPDRLMRAAKMLKETKHKSKRLVLYLEWFFCSHLIESIELKVEHWQVSSKAEQSATGVYTAGIQFSRYDQIVKEFDDGKLAKVINISRKILQNPSKKAIQKLGQDLIAETGFDEHLYFTD